MQKDQVDRRWTRFALARSILGRGMRIGRPRSHLGAGWRWNAGAGGAARGRGGASPEFTRSRAPGRQKLRGGSR